MDDPLVTEEALTAAATFSLMTDALPAALEYVQALDRMPDHGMYSGTFLPDRVRILLAAGRHDQARKAVHEDTVATHRPGCHLNARALLAEADRQTEQAEQAEQAAELYRQAAHQLRGGPVLERAQALHGQGRCLQQASHPGSQDALRDAEALLSNLGAHHLTRQLDALLHGHTPIRRTQTI